MKKMKLNLQFFGGRGAGLPTAHPSGSGGGSGAEWTTTPNVNSPQTLRQALGTRGRVMSMEKAASGANPYYDGSYREFSENCQRAVVAYEARRRGYIGGGHSPIVIMKSNSKAIPYAQYVIDGQGKEIREGVIDE